MIDIPPLRIPPCLVPYCCFQWYAVVTLLPILLYCTSSRYRMAVSLPKFALYLVFAKQKLVAHLQRRQAIANF